MCFLSRLQRSVPGFSKAFLWYGVGCLLGLGLHLLKERSWKQQPTWDKIMREVEGALRPGHTWPMFLFLANSESPGEGLVKCIFPGLLVSSFLPYRSILLKWKWSHPHCIPTPAFCGCSVHEHAQLLFIFWKTRMRLYCGLDRTIWNCPHVTALQPTKWQSHMVQLRYCSAFVAAFSKTFVEYCIWRRSVP